MNANQINHTFGNAVGERPQTPLEAESEKLSVSLNSLGVTAEVLVQRLSTSVLRPETVVQMATAGGTRGPEPAPRVTMCNAAERLLEQRQRVDNITTQLQQALDRLEA